MQAMARFFIAIRRASPAIDGSPRRPPVGLRVATDRKDPRRWPPSTSPVNAGSDTFVRCDTDGQVEILIEDGGILASAYKAGNFIL